MTKSMNIWIINQFAGTPDVPGSERSYQFAKAFSEMGHHVTLWTSSYSHWGKIEAIKDNVPYINKNEGNLNIIYLKTRPIYYRNDYRRFLNMFYFAYTLSRTSKTIVNPLDVVIASYPSPFAAVAAYRLSVRYNARFVLEIRDLWPQVWVERRAFSRYHPFVIILYALEKYLYKRTRIFVKALPYINDYLNEKGVNTQNVSWIPNGINLDDFKTEEKHDLSFEEESSILDIMSEERQKGKMNVVYVGSFGVGNRVDCILKAANMLKDKGEKGISFFIIGEGHSKKELIKYVSDNKLTSVKIWPAIPRKAVPQVLSCADVGVVCLHDNPIYRYGVNLHKVYDYMAAGLPIVFSARVRNNLVESSNAGITVPPGDSTEIASALQKFRSMTKEERYLIGKRGYEAIAKDYNVKRLAEKYLSIIGRDEYDEYDEYSKQFQDVEIKN